MKKAQAFVQFCNTCRIQYYDYYYQNRSYAIIYMMKYNTYEMFLAADVIKQR